MLFPSLPFIAIFLPVCLIGFYLSTYLREGASVVWLLGCSIVFYAYWSVEFAALLIVSSAINWLVGKRIASSGRKKTVLTLGLLWNFGLLGYFKYTNFFIGSFNQAFALDIPFLHLVLPLGISFFTFQKIAYIVDIYRGKAAPSGPVEFALFVFFFPQLIAGPIVHHAEMMPQIRKLWSSFDRKSFTTLFTVGVTIFVFGMFKKVVIADGIAPYSSVVFAAAEQGSLIRMGDAWQAALSYTVQLYFDFSGYTDMAIGLACMLGISLPANFNSPYKSTSVIEFWSRWHMTLSRFLRDYLYIPLGGNRFGALRQRINLMIVMILGGLWHGAGWTFVIWGALHGAFLIIAHWWKKSSPPMPFLLAWAVTMAAIISAWVFFRAPSVNTALNILSAMWGLHGLHSGEFFSSDGFGLAWRLIVAAALLPNLQSIMGALWPRIVPSSDHDTAPVVIWRPSMVWGISIGFMVTAIALLSSGTSEFLYFQF